MSPDSEFLKNTVQDFSKPVTGIENLSLYQRERLIYKLLGNIDTRGSHIELDKASAGIILKPIHRSTGYYRLYLLCRLSVKLLSPLAYRPYA